MIYLVRHGETDFNKFHVSQGRTDTSLNSKGLEQAKTLSKKLKDFKYDVIFCSSLTRAKQTCDYITKYHKCPVFYDDRIVEVGKGSLETHINTMETYKKFFANPHEFGGESEEDVFKRVRSFLKDLKKYKGKEILIISHGGMYKYIKHILEKKDEKKDPLEKIDMDNCGVVEFKF